MSSSAWTRSSIIGRGRTLGLVAVLAVIVSFALSGGLSETALATGAWADCNQALYSAQEGNGGSGQRVMRIDCNGNIEVFATGLFGPSGLAVSGNTMYISDDGPDIFRVETNGTVTQLSWSSSIAIGNPNGLDVDSSGRLLVADATGTIWRLTIDTSGSVTLAEEMATGFPTPQGVHETSSGDVLFVDSNGLVYSIAPTDTTPIVHPGISNQLVGGSTLVAGNSGHIAIDPAGNIFVSDFSTRIGRINPSGTTYKDVVSIPVEQCDSTQSGNDKPSFRGLVFSPDGDLVATGYCTDNIYIFPEADLTNAFNTSVPISSLPTPFVENPGGALDAPYFNGPFGVQFWDADVPPFTANACLPPDQTGSNTIYVDDSNSGTEDGSSGNPWNTVQEAVNAANPGDIILIAGGTYVENVNVTKSDLHFIGTDPGAQAIMSAAGGLSAMTIPATTDVVSIQNLRFVSADNNASGFVAGIIVYGSSDPRGIEICNNVFDSNEAGIAAQKTSPIVINNTFVNNTFSGMSAAVDSLATIRNNIFLANSKGIDTASATLAANVSIDHNLFYNNSSDIYSTVSCSAGCIFGSNPLLVDVVGNNYHLLGASPAIDTGSEEGAPDKDFDQGARPLDGDANGSAITDIGADEVDPASPPPSPSAVPIASEWALGLLALLLVGAFVFTMRRRTASS